MAWLPAHLPAWVSVRMSSCLSLLLWCRCELKPEHTHPAPHISCCPRMSEGWCSLQNLSVGSRLVPHHSSLLVLDASSSGTSLGCGLGIFCGTGLSMIALFMARKLGDSLCKTVEPQSSLLHTLRESWGKSYLCSHFQRIISSRFLSNASPSANSQGGQNHFQETWDDNILARTIPEHGIHSHTPSIGDHSSRTKVTFLSQCSAIRPPLQHGLGCSPKSAEGVSFHVIWPWLDLCSSFKDTMCCLSCQKTYRFGSVALCLRDNSKITVGQWLALILKIWGLWQKTGMINGSRNGLDVRGWCHWTLSRMNRFLAPIYLKKNTLILKTLCDSANVPKG